jgi:hypothetical protein
MAYIFKSATTFCNIFCESKCSKKILLQYFEHAYVDFFLYVTNHHLFGTKYMNHISSSTKKMHPTFLSNSSYIAETCMQY